MYEQQHRFSLECPVMPISGHGWELHVQRLGVHVSGSKKRTYGSYQVFQDGRALDGLSGFICECIGPGENTVPGTAQRIAQGTYPLSTQFGRYRTVGYSDDTSTAGRPPMPAILVEHTINRSGILIHPGHPPNLFLSSIGCFNPTSALLSWQEIDFWDSRSRVIALIDDLHRFAPDAFHSIENTMIPNASIVVDGEPMNILVSPDEAPMLAGAAGGEVPPPDHPALELDDVFSSLAGGAGAAASVTGADTNYAVRQDVIDAVKPQLGGKPLFWGRYFKSPSTAGGVQYNGSLENSLLRSNNILVLPIGRQTNHVSGSEQTGRTDARNNADAIVDAFSLDTLRNRTTRLLVFLDVEPENPVSADYYFGWASALVAYHNPPIFAPALYGNFGSSATWAALSQAVSRGAECHGLWVARYFINAGCVPKPVWSNHAIPQGIPNGVQVLAWQFSAECVGADCNIVNPNSVQQLTDGLILPPAPALPPVVGALPLAEAAPVSATRYADALQATFDQLVGKADARKLPDGRPFFFPDGIRSLEITVNPANGVTLKINE
jgi:hypothetical protein